MVQHWDSSWLLFLINHHFTKEWQSFVVKNFKIMSWMLPKNCYIVLSFFFCLFIFKPNFFLYFKDFSGRMLLICIYWFRRNYLLKGNWKKKKKKTWKYHRKVIQFKCSCKGLICRDFLDLLISWIIIHKREKK